MTRSLHRALACVGLLLGFVPAAAQAQRTTITGRVLNEVNAPLDAASVAVTGMNIVVSTNPEGRFTIVIPSAQQQISSEELNTTFAPNVENQLEGKVSGVTIVGKGTQGGSTSINIRGYTSITGSNQPLFIVDGIPVSNADRGSSAQSGGMLGSKDFGNAI